MDIGLINDTIAKIANFYEALLFFNVLSFTKNYHFSFLIGWLLFAALFFVYLTRFSSFTMLGVGLKQFFSNALFKEQEAEALKFPEQKTSRHIVKFAIGSCIDLSSIFGVALVIKHYGPGTIFWMLVSGIIGASLRFSEVIVALHYRTFSSGTGIYVGGPHQYIKQVFIEKGLPRVGIFLSILFSLLLVFSTFFSPQVNQTVMFVTHLFPSIEHYNWIIAITIAAFIITIISGGFARVVTCATKIVSVMSKIYIVIAIVIISVNIRSLGSTLMIIIQDAFSLKSGLAGLLTMIAVSTQRIFFTNEFGMGSGAIAHTNSVNKDPVSEAALSLVVPLACTILICVCSGLTIVITGAYLKDVNSTAMVLMALDSVSSWFRYLMVPVVPLFGISTALAWAYYGQVTFKYIFGDNKVFIYFILLFIAYSICGSSTDFKMILSIADSANLSIAIPNIVALYLLSGLIKKIIKEKK